MRTDSFSKEKHLPVRRFIADESKIATGLYGPVAIAEDLDNLHAMFDPEADILSGTQKGGIAEKNLQNDAVSYEKLSPALREKLEVLSQKADQLQAEKQDKHSDALPTESKTIVGAITELHQEKAEKEYVDAQLSEKAEKEHVDSELSNRPTFREANSEAYLQAFNLVSRDELKTELATAENPNTIIGAIAENRKKLLEKVDKVDGKGLSSNDFTDAEKSKLARFEDADNYATNDMVFGVQDRVTELEFSNQFLRGAFESFDHSLSQYQYKYEPKLLTEEKEIAYAINELHSTKQNKETVLEEFVVNTPIWENQPGVKVSGSMQLEIFDPITEEYVGELLAPLFNTSDFYYVTLNDASGTALPDGQFMLKHFYSDTVPIDCLFYLEGLDTGTETGTLSESLPVEIAEADGVWKLRHAGVPSISYPLDKNFPETGGKISISVFGHFCPRISAGYYATLFTTDKNIIFSDQNKIWGKENTSMYIRNYTNGIGAGVDFKTIKFKDELTLTRNIGNFFSTERNVFVAKRKYNDSTDSGFATSVSSVSGLGELLYPDTKLKEVRVTALSELYCGVLRNGTVIRITEVK